VLAKRQKCLRVLMYHGVPHASAAVFETQIRYLKAHFSIVSLDEIIASLVEGNVRANLLALTFDDGLRNNFTVAYPVLQKFAAPATFFVCPGLVGTGGWIWTHEARMRLRSLQPGEFTEFSKLAGVPAGGVEEMIEWMKCLECAQRGKIETALRTYTSGFSPTQEQRELYDLMSWEELSRLDAELITIGSHTMVHPILSALDEANCAREISDSRTLLEARLGRKVDYFCYPNGAKNDFVVKCVRKSYRAAVSTECNVLTPINSLFNLPRIPSAETIELLAWRLHRPGA